MALQAPEVAKVPGFRFPDTRKPSEPAGPPWTEDTMETPAPKHHVKGVQGISSHIAAGLRLECCASPWVAARRRAGRRSCLRHGLQP